MGDDEHGIPFTVVTSEQYMKRATDILNQRKGIIDISMDFL